MRYFAVPACVLVALLVGCTGPNTRITATRCDLATNASDGETVALGCDVTHRGDACQAVFRVDILDGHQRPIRSTNHRYENEHGFVAAGKTVLLSPDEPATVAVTMPARELEATTDVLPAWARYGLYEPGGAALVTEMTRLPARVQRAALRAALGNTAEVGAAAAAEPVAEPAADAAPAVVSPRETTQAEPEPAPPPQDTPPDHAVADVAEPAPAPQETEPTPVAPDEPAIKPATPPVAKRSAPATATQPSASSKAARSFLYTVRRGDTLSGMAQRFYNNAARWEEIYAQNMDVLESPDDLREGMVLEIPLDDDRTSPPS